MQLYSNFPAWLLLSMGVAVADNYDLRPFKVDVAGRVPHMLDLINRTNLPEHDVFPGDNSSFGMSLDVLRSLKNQWTEDFDWQTEQDAINKYKQYTAKIEGQTIHFIHERSPDPDAIPLILLHGWPGSFLEMQYLIEPLTTPTPIPTQQNTSSSSSSSSSGPVSQQHQRNVSFHVVVPSLPGFGFSSPPPAFNWTNADTARVFDTLMTAALGYRAYAVHGTDWGSFVAWDLYGGFNASARALHLNFVPALPLLPDELAARNISLDGPDEEESEQLWVRWQSTGSGYFEEQATKPNDIGLALLDNPVGQLVWIGEKLIEWSDPRAGTAPSQITHHEILRHVSLYYLSESFQSSVYIYAQNAALLNSPFNSHPNTDAPFLYSNFKYNAWFWPRQLVETVENLVFYKYHEFGGHFPALDNPPALIADLREIANYWEK
ncbi:Alpha/Beta hydrolase protein [Xylariaceae sp. FL0662B]|nr:Alpha/Beta hydrolase protein [Xylariaceae sp. FL0662B]